MNRQEEYFDEVRTIIATAEKLPARLGEVMGQTMGIQWHRGTEWALNQARAFRDEVKHRADNRMWVCPNEQYRLMYVGAGLWQNLDFFTEFEEKYGAVFVRSNYLSIASDGYLRYGTRDPLRCLASRYVTISEQMHIPGLGGAWAIWEARRHRVNGGLSLGGWWGQRIINFALEEQGIPVLDFPVDPVDANSGMTREMRHLVSEFIEQRVAPTAHAQLVKQGEARFTTTGSQRMRRREVVRILALGAGLSVAAACAPTAPATVSPTAAPGFKPAAAPAGTSASAAQPRSGGTLRFAQNVEIASGGAAGTSPLDGQTISPAPLSAIWLGYDSLVRYDTAFKPQPMLAESWDLGSDYKSIKFNLRKGVQFHTGREFTSEDVKYNLLRVRKPNIAPQFTNMSNWWTSVETPG